MTKIRRGDIYYANLSPVIGSEQAGIRPVLILQNNKGNTYSTTTIIAPITSKRHKARLPTHIDIAIPQLRYKSTILLEQIRSIDKNRLLCFIGTLGHTSMQQVERAIFVSLGIAVTPED